MAGHGERRHQMFRLVDVLRTEGLGLALARPLGGSPLTVVIDICLLASVIQFICGVWRFAFRPAFRGCALVKWVHVHMECSISWRLHFSQSGGLKRAGLTRKQNRGFGSKYLKSFFLPFFFFSFSFLPPHSQITLERMVQDSDIRVLSNWVNSPAEKRGGESLSHHRVVPVFHLGVPIDFISSSLALLGDFPN